VRKEDLSILSFSNRSDIVLTILDQIYDLTLKSQRVITPQRKEFIQVLQLLQDNVVTDLEFDCPGVSLSNPSINTEEVVAIAKSLAHNSSLTSIRLYGYDIELEGAVPYGSILYCISREKLLD
jgi:hypothetical protein